MRRTRITNILATVLLTAAVGPLGLAAASANAATVADDFSQGTNNGTAVVAGQVQLKPVVDEPLGGDALPANWTQGQWTEGSGSTNVANGAVTVDGTYAGDAATYPAGRSLEFVATFGDADFQHAGFGVDYNNTQAWAMFSTGGSNNVPRGLWARSNNGTVQNTQITGFSPTDPHHYRIDWTPTTVTFFIDGQQVAQHAIAINTEMRPLVSDFNAGGPGLTVESLRMSSYAPTGTFVSSVLDGGLGLIGWQRLNAATETPDGTQVAFETRSGESATPDASWSDWGPPGDGNSIVSPTQEYLQYRAILSSSDGLTTPTLSTVAVDFANDTQAPISSITGVSVNGKTAVATFTSDDPEAMYECSLDGSPFASCTSPATFSGLPAGTHTFVVRGTDLYGNAGGLASREFVIVGDAPQSGSDNLGNSGSAAPPVVQPPVGTTRDTIAPKLVIGPRSVQVSKAGWATLKVTCPAGETRCKVVMRLKLGGKTVAQKTVTILGGKTMNVSLKLSASARAKLAKHKSLKVIASGTATDAAGNVKTTSISITLKPAPAGVQRSH
jgi:hypothetical protein